MPTDAPLAPFSLLLGLFCVSGLVEHSLYGGFNRFYYTHGLPFVVRRIPVQAFQRDLPPADQLAARFRSEWISSLVFQPIAPDTYGFRRAFFRWAFFPLNLMHGLLFFDRTRGEVVVKGFFNFSVPLGILALGAFFLLGPFEWSIRLLSLGVVVLLLGIPLFMERRRCVELARFAAEVWKMII